MCTALYEILLIYIILSFVLESLMGYNFVWRILVYLSRVSYFVGCDATSGTSSSPSDSMKEPGEQTGIPASLFSTAFYFALSFSFHHWSTPIFRLLLVFSIALNVQHIIIIPSNSWMLHFQPAFTLLHSKEVTYLSFACSSSEVTSTDSFLVCV
jgi:hypothetical protein